MAKLDKPTLLTIRGLQTLRAKLKEDFVDRDTAIDAIVLSALCRENALLIGDPGTGKTQVVTRFAREIDASHFGYMLTRFTEPSELFGPLDVEKFQQGQFLVRTSGMLPEAEIAFLDEVFLGSSAILNTLLTLLNERIFFNGSVRQASPLISVIGACNHLPDDTTLQAFADRFLLRVHLESVADDYISDLLDVGWQHEQAVLRKPDAAGPGADGSVPELVTRQLKAAHIALAAVDLQPVAVEYANMIREMRAQGVSLSDRRAVKGQRLVAGAALMRESLVAGLQDFWPLYHMWSAPADAALIQGIVQPRVLSAGGEAMRSIRDVADIRLDFDLLLSRSQGIRTDGSYVAHLSDVNKLRRELLRDHRDNVDLLRDIDRHVRTLLARMEEAHV